MSKDKMKITVGMVDDLITWLDGAEYDMNMPYEDFDILMFILRELKEKKMIDIIPGDDRTMGTMQR